MQNPFQPNLRKPWILLCTTTLVIYAIVPFRHETLYDLDAFSTWLEVVMFLLSFPLGDVVMSLFYNDGAGIIERFVFWGLALAVGYVQWFHLFPALIRNKRPRVTTLNLAPCGGAAPSVGAAHSAGSLGPGQAAEADNPPVPQFNDRGLTPLERVFRGEDAEG